MTPAMLGGLVGATLLNYLAIRGLERVTGKTQRGAIVAGTLAAAVELLVYAVSADSFAEFQAKSWLYLAGAAFWTMVDVWRFAPKR